MSKTFFDIRESHAWKSDRDKLEHCILNERDESRLGGAYQEYRDHTSEPLDFDRWYDKQREALQRNV
jgi:hypothetical protein